MNRCESNRLCTPFPKYKKITQNDQIKIMGNCVYGCFEDIETNYLFKFYQNNNLNDFNFSNINWIEFQMNDIFFSGNLKLRNQFFLLI